MCRTTQAFVNSQAGVKPVNELRPSDARAFLEATQAAGNPSLDTVDYHELDIAAGPTGSVNLHLYRPLASANTTLPVTVYFHGAGFPVLLVLVLVPVLPRPAPPYPALLYPALPCSALPCSAPPCPALPCPALPCSALSRPVIALASVLVPALVLTPVLVLIIVLALVLVLALSPCPRHIRLPPTGS